jgi:hypothetical protein
LAHDARDPFLTARHPLILQLAVHPRTAVRSAAARMDRSNPHGEYDIGLHALAERLRTPFVEPGPRHPEHPTHRHDVKDPLVRADEQKPHRASLAKKAVAFVRFFREFRG